MEVSTMFSICRYCIFTWYGSILSLRSNTITFCNSLINFSCLIVSEVLLLFSRILYVCFTEIRTGFMALCDKSLGTLHTVVSKFFECLSFAFHIQSYYFDTKVKNVILRVEKQSCKFREPFLIFTNR